MKIYNKLVRDKILDIISSNNESPAFHLLNDEEYLQELHKKLFEEANEFVENDDKEELADVLEVLYAIAKVKHIDLNDVEKIRIEKRQKRGGFENRIFLETVEIKGDNNEKSR